jgi:hypothetical protein
MSDMQSDRLEAAARVLEPQAQEPRDLPGAGPRRRPPARKRTESDDSLDLPTHKVDSLA